MTELLGSSRDWTFKPIRRLRGGVSTPKAGETTILAIDSRCGQATRNLNSFFISMGAAWLASVGGVTGRSDYHGGVPSVPAGTLGASAVSRRLRQAADPTDLSEFSRAVPGVLARVATT